MRRVLAIPAAALALAGCGGDDERGKRPAIDLTDRGTAPQVPYGHAAQLAGRVTGRRVDAVEVEASPYPYRSYGRAGTAKPSRDGRFTFSAKPQRNTRYRARAAGVTSKPVLVLVALRPQLDIKVRGPHRISFFLTGIGPHGVRPRPHTKVFFYFKRRSASGLRRLGARPPRQFGPEAVRAGGTFALTSKKGDRFYACARAGGMAVGIGYKGSPVRGCGDPALMP